MQSPNYPNNYSNAESCDILAPPDTKLYITHFDTQDGHDNLTIDGVQYSGTTRPPQGLVSSEILWSSDVSHSSTGWEVCTATGVML